MAVGRARLHAVVMDRFEIRSITQPLFKQQGGSGAVQPSGAVAGKAMALCRRPAAAVFIHPGDRQVECMA